MTPSVAVEIDHIIMDSSDVHLVVSCCVHDDGPDNISDHNALSLHLSFRTNVCLPQVRKAYKWIGADVNRYARLLDLELISSCMESDVIDESNDLNIYCDKLIDTITKVSDKCIPKTKYRSFLKPYLTPEVKLLHKRQKLLRSIWISEGRPRGMNYHSYKAYKNAKTVFASELQAAADEYEQRKYDDMCESHDMDIQRFWKYVNKQRRGNTSNDFHVINDDLHAYSTPESQFIMWVEHFKTLLNENCTEDITSTHVKAEHQRVNDNILHILKTSNRNRAPNHVNLSEFTISEIKTICNALPKGKAPGIDSLTYEHFKYGGKILIQCVVKLFNVIIAMVKIPHSFKRGLLFTLHKGHGKPKNQKNSYRGITLLPVLNKIFEKCIVSRMGNLFKYQNFPPTLQHAVRKGSNNIMLSYSIQECINYHVENSGKVYACFLDLMRAFDVISWNGLFYKMYQIGITDKLWLLFYDWFNGSTCSLFFNGKLSQDFTISRSIKQGGVFSMYAFCIMFYDVHTYVDPNHLYGLTYKDVYIGSPALADDLTLLSCTKQGLDIMMHNVTLYSQIWKLNFSPNKTKCMVFGEGPRVNNVNKGKRQFLWVTLLLMKSITTYMLV